MLHALRNRRYRLPTCGAHLESCWNMGLNHYMRKLNVRNGGMDLFGSTAGRTPAARFVPRCHCKAIARQIVKFGSGNVVRSEKGHGSNTERNKLNSMPFWKPCLIGSLATVCLSLATGCTPIVDRYREASSEAEDSHQVASPVNFNSSRRQRPKIPVPDDVKDAKGSKQPERLDRKEDQGEFCPLDAAMEDPKCGKQGGGQGRRFALVVRSPPQSTSIAANTRTNVPVMSVNSDHEVCSSRWARMRVGIARRRTLRMIARAVIQAIKGADRILSPSGDVPILSVGIG